MAHKELINELIQRKSNLLVELEAIEALIKVYEVDVVSTISIVKDEVKPIAKYEGARNTSGAGIPKGNTSWSKYAFNILAELESAKASQIAKLAILANPSLPEQRIKNAITSKLSILYSKNVIEADEPANKADGYLYRIKKESNDSD